MAATRGQLWRYLAEVVSAGSGHGLVEQIQADGAGELLLREQIWSHRRLGHRGPTTHCRKHQRSSVKSGSQRSVRGRISRVFTIRDTFDCCEIPARPTWTRRQTVRWSDRQTDRQTDNSTCLQLLSRFLMTLITSSLSRCEERGGGASSPVGRRRGSCYIITLTRWAGPAGSR